MESIPSHRQFLTALVESLSHVPAPLEEDAPPSSPSPPSSSPSAPKPTSRLNAVPLNQRHLLLTLHVLFPNLLLPALDLLDRGLVTRFRLVDAEDDTEPAAVGTSDGEDAVTRAGVSKTPLEAFPAGTFIVKSIATTLTRRTRDMAASSQRYIVHLGPWNCSCASFTFESFPIITPPALPQRDVSLVQCEDDMSAWLFGGAILDDVASTGDVPCCKHLLACLMVERWPGMMGDYANERTVTKEEMAGIVADL